MVFPWLLYHIIFDFDKITTTMHGHNNTNFVAGIVMQEVKDQGFFTEWTQAASHGAFPVAISPGRDARYKDSLCYKGLHWKG